MNVQKFWTHRCFQHHLHKLAKVDGLVSTLKTLSVLVWAELSCSQQPRRSLKAQVQRNTRRVSRIQVWASVCLLWLSRIASRGSKWHHKLSITTCRHKEESGSKGASNNSQTPKESEAFGEVWIHVDKIPHTSLEVEASPQSPVRSWCPQLPLPRGQRGRWQESPQLIWNMWCHVLGSFVVGLTNKYGGGFWNFFLKALKNPPSANWVSWWFEPELPLAHFSFSFCCLFWLLIIIAILLSRSFLQEAWEHCQVKMTIFKSVLTQQGK